VVVLASLVGAGVVLWRRRRRSAQQRPRSESRRERAALAALRKDDLAGYAEAEEQWRRRRDVLADLLRVAQGAPAGAVPGGLAPLPDERLLHSVTARLTESVESGRAGAAVEVDRGQLVVTDQRLAFVGEQQRRDWWHALVSRICHVDHRHTTIELWDSEVRSGVEYDDPEVTRLYLDLAVSVHDGSSATYLAGIEQGLRNHEMRRPAPPRRTTGDRAPA
jgi:hypothetical protein